LKSFFHSCKSKIKISSKEAQELEKAFVKGKLAIATRDMISKKANISWSTGGHSALPVLCSSIGPQSEKFTGFMENTQIANIFKAMVE
jgi:alkaline phosphatase